MLPILERSSRTAVPRRSARRSLFALAAAFLTTAIAWPQDAIWGVRLGGLQGGNQGNDVAEIPGGGGDFYVCGTVQDAVQYVFGVGTAHELVIPIREGRREDPFLARYRADGTPVWVRIGRGTAIDTASRLSVFPDGSVVIVGTYNGFVSGLTRTGITFDGGTEADITIANNADTRAYMARYTANGDIVFARQIVIGGSTDVAEDLVALPGGGYFVVGSFRGGTFGDANDPNPIPMPLGASFGILSSDGFVARYQPNGNILWVHRVKNSAGDNVSAAERMPDGDLVLTCEIGRRDILPVTFFPGHPAELTLAPDPTRRTHVLRLDFAEDPTSTTAGFRIDWIRALGGYSNLTGDHVVRRGPADEIYLAGNLPADPADPSGGFMPATYGSAHLLPGSSVSRCYIARIDANGGELLWAVGATHMSDAAQLDLAPTRDGLVFVLAGGFNKDLITSTGTSWGNFPQACHAKVDLDGVPQWARPDSVVPYGSTTLQGRYVVATGVSATVARLDLGLPTQIILPAPNYRCYLGQYEVAPGTSLAVPEDIARSCDPGVHGATVHFVVEVSGAPAGSRLEVRNSTSNVTLATIADPDGEIGVGPVSFPMGVSSISVQLLDAANAVILEDGFLVTVEDTTPPVIDGCGPRTIECTGPETELLLSVLGLSATDECDPEPELSLAPAAVPHGTTTVTATARDHAGNTSSCSFLVTVVDTIPPMFTVIPTDIERECSMPHGAIVTFDVLAEDVCGVASLVCVDQTSRVIDAAGTFFEHGTHTVTCTASDASQNSASISFQVRIVDTTAPVLIAPNDLSLPNDPGEATAVAHFQVTATELCDPQVAITCTAPWGPVQSGDAFPIGTTVVVCVALDHAQNRAEASFSITVYDAEPPVFSGNTGGSITLTTDCAGRPLAIDGGSSESTLEHAECRPGCSQRGRRGRGRGCSECGRGCGSRALRCAVQPQAASIGVIVEDNVDPNPVVESNPSILFPGVTTVTVTARDADGNQSSTTVQVTVLKGAFEWDLLRPLDPHVDNRICPGRVVPIKLRVSCGNCAVTDVSVAIDAIELLGADGTPIANEAIEDPGACHDEGGVFRRAGNHYHYNLSTASWVETRGARHRVTVRIQKSGHVDTLAVIYFVNR